MNNLFWADENSIEQCFAASNVANNVANNTEQVVEPERYSLQSGVTMLNNIVDNLEQCGQRQNIVRCSPSFPGPFRWNCTNQGDIKQNAHLQAHSTSINIAACLAYCIRR